MATDECRGDQQLDTDEEKEEPSLVLASVFSEGESMRGKQKRDRRTEEQEYSHARCLMLKGCHKGYACDEMRVNRK